MFKKIVANLPFHPAALEQVGFYLRRLRQEDSIRRAGLVLTALLIVLQVYIFISPTKPSLATSANDIIYGGGTKEQILQVYNNNRDGLGRTDIQAIFNHYGIGANQIAAATYERIGSKQKRFVSTGRSTSPGVDTFISIPGAQDGGVYQRPLSSWDHGSRQSYYHTVTGISSYGFRFWIITRSCGNIVFEENAPIPNLNIIKKASSTAVAPGGSLTFSIQFQNTGPATARDVVITDTLPNEFTYVSYTSNIDLVLTRSGQLLSWKIANANSELPASQRWYNIDIVIKVQDISESKRVCNAASIGASGVTARQTINSENERCVNIDIPTDSQLVCQYLKIIGMPAWDSRKFETAFSATDSTALKQINYYINNSKIANLPIASGTASQLYTHQFPDEGTYTIKAEIETNAGETQTSQSCQLSETIVKTTTPQPRIITDKTVENLTQKISDANGTVAAPGDQLKYTVTITNSGDADYHGLKLEGDYGESINDILEYSTIVDLGDAKYNNQTHFLTWDAVNIPAGVTVNKSFIVQVKNPLPNTPTSASDPLSYDFNMQNEYGRLVIVHLKKPATKIIEQTARELPNTGPGTSLIISALAAIVIGYFFYRGRLLSRELEIVHHSYRAGGL